jgi:hypothetical protein
MVGAAFMAFKTRNVPSAFDESQHIANAIFLLIFFAVIIVPLDILVQDNPNASIIIQGIGQSFLGIMLLVVLFGPKLYYIASGKANDKKMLEVATSTGNKQSGATGRKGAAPVTKSPTASNTSGSAGVTASSSTAKTNVPSTTATVPSSIPLSSVTTVDSISALSSVLSQFFSEYSPSSLNCVSVASIPSSGAVAADSCNVTNLSLIEQLQIAVQVASHRNLQFH